MVKQTKKLRKQISHDTNPLKFVEGSTPASIGKLNERKGINLSVLIFFFVWEYRTHQSMPRVHESCYLTLRFKSRTYSPIWRDCVFCCLQPAMQNTFLVISSYKLGTKPQQSSIVFLCSNGCDELLLITLMIIIIRSSINHTELKHGK